MLSLAYALTVHALSAPAVVDADSKFALKASREPAAIKRYVANSKGVLKHWVNKTGGKYVVTFMTDFPFPLMDDAMKRGYAVLCHKASIDLNAADVPVSMIIMRFSDGYIVGAY